MSRSGYIDDGFESREDQWRYICYRGAVKSAIKGKRGQAFIKEAIKALDALPTKELISYELEEEGQFCTLGAVGLSRDIDMSDVDVAAPCEVAALFKIPESLVREIEFENDEGAFVRYDDAKGRWRYMRNWLESQLNTTNTRNE